MNRQIIGDEFNELEMCLSPDLRRDAPSVIIVISQGMNPTCIQISKAKCFDESQPPGSSLPGSGHVSNRAVTRGVVAVMDEAALYAEVGVFC